MLKERKGSLSFHYKPRALLSTVDTIWKKENIEKYIDIK